MEGTIAEIRMFASNFAPRSWLFCQGQTMNIAQNTAMFSLLGTTYGGNGQTTFGIPDFRGRVPVGTGQGPGLSNHVLGDLSGAENFIVNNTSLPAHTHVLSGSITMKGNAATGDTDTPQANYPAGLTGTNMYSTVNNGSGLGNMKLALTGAVTGSSQPVNNVQPVMGMNYIICQFGIFPSRN